MQFYLNISRRAELWPNWKLELRKTGVAATDYLEWGRMQLPDNLSEAGAVARAKELREMMPSYNGWKLELFRTWQTNAPIKFENDYYNDRDRASPNFDDEIPF